MDNQKRSTYGTPFKEGTIEGDVLLLYQIQNKKNWMVRCLNCNRELEMTPCEISEHRHNNRLHCKYCRTRKPCPTYTHHKGDIIGCYELLEIVNVPNRRRHWKARCIKCGKEQIVNISNIQHRKAEKCNYCDNPNYVPPKFHAGARPITKTLDERSYVNYRKKMENNSADELKKTKPWELTLEQYSELIHGNCFYCGDAPSADNQWNKTGKRSGENVIFLQNGIDRIDSNKGYTKENCVSCCKKCNKMKWDLSQETFYAQIRKIMCHMSKRSTTIENTEISGSE